MKEHDNGIAQADSKPKSDPYDDFGDAVLAAFKGAARKARLRALDHDGYTTIIDGEIVTVRRAMTNS